MRSSFTPEEVDQIEEKAYEVGERIGRGLERERIIALLDTLKCGCDVDCDIVEISFRNLVTIIKGENK